MDATFIRDFGTSMPIKPPEESISSLNLTVRSVTRLADLQLVRTSNGREQGARPPRPAGYAQRYAPA